MLYCTLCVGSPFLIDNISTATNRLQTYFPLRVFQFKKMNSYPRCRAIKLKFLVGLGYCCTLKVSINLCAALIIATRIVNSCWKKRCLSRSYHSKIDLVFILILSFIDLFNYIVWSDSFIFKKVFQH